MALPLIHNALVCMLSPTMHPMSGTFANDCPTTVTWPPPLDTDSGETSKALAERSAQMTLDQIGNVALQLTYSE